MKIKKLSHVGMIVKNLEKTINFYTEVLGLELVDGPSSIFTDPEDGNRRRQLWTSASRGHFEDTRWEYDRADRVYYT